MFSRFSTLLSQSAARKIVLVPLRPQRTLQVRSMSKPAYEQPPLPAEDANLLGKGAKKVVPAEGEAVEAPKSNINPVTGEINGPKGPEPTRYGDYERGGRCYDF